MYIRYELLPYIRYAIVIIRFDIIEFVIYVIGSID